MPLTTASPGREICPTCDGNGCEYGCGRCKKAYAGPDSHRICRSCGGNGTIPMLNTANIVVKWDATDGGVLGAIVVCNVCGGDSHGCQTCDGTGELFQAYHVNNHYVIEPQSTADNVKPTVTLRYDGPVAPSSGH